MQYLNYEIEKTGGQFGMGFVQLGNCMLELDNVFHFEGKVIGDIEIAEVFIERGLQVHPKHPDKIAVKDDTYYPIFMTEGRMVVSFEGFSKGDYVFNHNYRPDWHDIATDPRKFEALRRMCFTHMGQVPNRINAAYLHPTVNEWVKGRQVLSYMPLNLWGRCPITHDFQAEESAINLGKFLQTL